MANSTARENILKKIRQALGNPVPLPFPKIDNTTSVYQPAKDELDIIFAVAFTQLQGKFVFCIDDRIYKASFNN